MSRRILLLADALLLLVATYFGVRLYEAWSARSPVAPAETAPAAAADAPPARAATSAAPPLTAYAIVAERNLFSPTRNETPPEPPRPAAGATPPAPPAPKPRLYGVVLLPEGRGRAYLEDAQRRRVFAYSVGDQVGDSRLEQIKTDRVVLRRGSESFEVLLYDPTKPRQPAVQSPDAGGTGRPAPEAGGAGRPVARPPVPGPSPVPGPPPGVRGPVRPRVVVPPPAPPPSADAQEQPEEE